VVLPEQLAFRAPSPYTNLRSNALLAFDGSLGHVTEVLSGTNYEPLSTSSPQQIWSAAMVVSPMLRGMFGLQRDAATSTLTFAPHVPADWDSYTLRNVRIGGAQVDLLSVRYHVHLAGLDLTKTADVVKLQDQIKVAAQKACKAIQDQYPTRSMSDEQTCVTEATGRGMAQAKDAVAAAEKGSK